DPDPENEIGDIERPKDRPFDARHREAVPHLIAPGGETDEYDGTKKSQERIKPARCVTQKPQAIAIDFSFRLTIPILNVGPTAPTTVATWPSAAAPTRISRLLLQIGYFRQRAEIFQQLCSARRSREPRHLAFRIVQVSKHERRRWARLHTGRLDFAI